MNNGIISNFVKWFQIHMATVITCLVTKVWVYLKCIQFREYYKIDLNVTILQNNIKTAAARRYHEDKWICKLKTLAPHGLNTEIGDYAKEMYNFY